ncbi:hypothetical protein KSF_092760 [Reticulibacter mediterranei]|uniref:Uncharacterized protein n=1 Tax=Reticulibacter mediterranei TaxID=2778369 RepID=A0A8J3IRV9_9CHLR|nr:hypothetical protein KSF_092760 [Reticulibacter mediterranei]
MYDRLRRLQGVAANYQTSKQSESAQAKLEKMAIGNFLLVCFSKENEELCEKRQEWKGRCYDEKKT